MQWICLPQKHGSRQHFYLDMLNIEKDMTISMIYQVFRAFSEILAFCAEESPATIAYFDERGVKNKLK